ncbi:APC amino acid permease [Dichomitus squalens LYAD-421 SS1]|uniref:APC amino acid permease n=1 Tax=Dichomitus squalens (strain LYAD-421) TaxID=732165 RepID=R7T2T0_DICSQ|nr:APC amino acid permease [Dichomitus squalens LYAD-421 SS1]EJF61992.1 APC amino acid permease [Dichomitus squalens LYAD-421 SS1]
MVTAKDVSAIDSEKNHGSVVDGVLDDEKELARMGYKQELKRDLTLLQNFGVSFSIISVITGIPSLFLYGLNTGGPAVMVWGFVVVAFFTCLVGLAMGEVCSAHPTSGGPYFWAAMLSDPKHAAFASWMTGWFNLLGQVAVTTGISYAAANFISTLATFNTSFVPEARITIGIYAGVLICQGLINTFGVHLLKYINNFSIWWHAVGTTAVVIAILAAAPKHQSAKFVFATFIDNTGVDGVGWSQRASDAYVVVIGILTAQYTLTGFDGSAHMTEETHNAAMSGSIGIIMAIGVSAVLGWFLMLGLLFSIQDLDGTINSATGQPVAQIFLDTVGEKGAIVLMVIVIGAMFFCGTFSVTSNSRMMYAFSRDGAIPGHKFFHKVDEKTKSPIRTVWLACTLSFILGLPSLGSSVAFSAATSIATIGLYISYGIPIALRAIYGKRFKRGPFHLGPFSYPVAIISCLWIVFISIAFILPQANPVDSQTLNYSIVAVGIVITYALGYWLISARKWFTGPIKQISANDMGVDSMDPTGSTEADTVQVNVDTKS